MNAFMAHSAANTGQWHSLKEHLTSVAGLAKGFASAFGAENEAYLAGLLHDLGKYGDLFQDRLQGRASGIDHWSMGAWAAASQYKGKALAACLAAAGHHLGIPAFDKDELAKLNPDKHCEDKRRLSEKSLELLLERLKADDVSLPQTGRFGGELTGSLIAAKAAIMLDFRMLFSALTDADFIDTEAHFKREPVGIKRHRPPGPKLEPALALETLLAHINNLAAGSGSAPAVNRMRADLLAACLEAAQTPPGQFTLSAPTGAGKTLAMLAFALKHAAVNGLRRVVMVIPYLTIIEQTAGEFRKVFKGKLPQGVDLEHYILEQHSMAGRAEDAGDSDTESEVERRRRELAQNWDAPIIVTTSVQALESLFAHRPGACRKLHRLAQSVILFDEVQTLPTPLAPATLATLGRLCERFGASVVFSTATQPAFEALSAKAAKLGGSNWAPREIAPKELGLFGRVKRVRVDWPSKGQVWTPDEVAQELAGERNSRSLCVLNLKRQTRSVLRALQEAGTQNLNHLSTSMCPAHRQEVLTRVRAFLCDPDEPPVRLISTQCVEAGVDLDFPVVWRAWGPLTSIAQAAGRCNRNGSLEQGRVRVIILHEKHPETGKALRPYPDAAYAQAAAEAQNLLNEYGSKGMDIDDPSLFRDFFFRLYDVTGAANNQNKLEAAIGRLDFADAAALYRLINQDGINVLVPYDPAVYDELAAEARQYGLSAAWVRRSRLHSIGLFRPRDASGLWDSLEPIPIMGKGRGEMSRDWFICPAEGMYDPLMGFDEQALPGLLVA